MATTDFRYPIKLNKLPVQGLVPEASTTAPAAPAEGQLWMDTANHLLKYWNLSAWKNPLDRGDHTGTQTAATISDLASTVQGYRLDQFAAPTGALNMNGQRVINAATPTAANDLANKAYVDNARAGIAGVKDPVDVVATTNVSLASVPAVIDGVTLSAGQSFLASAQTTGTENGIYSYPGSGQAATRRADADGTGEILDGTLVAVGVGSKAGTQWIQTATPSGAPGSWTQTWQQFSSGGQTYTADGQGLALTGTQFSLVLADASLVKSGSGLAVGNVSLAQGGTGATTAAGARTALGTVGKYTTTLGAITGGTPLTITHNLNTTAVLEPSLREISSGELVGGRFLVVDANNITLTLASSYAANTFAVTVAG